ncbi:MAG: hypothetical protein ACJ8C4_17745 [Gemmataceae bacterium]
MDVLATSRPEPTIWNRPPFVLSWNTRHALQCRSVRGAERTSAGPAPPWVDSGTHGEPFDFTAATAELCADICRHTPELSHIQTHQILFGFTQARNGRGHGLQARVTPLRFPGGHLVKHARGRLFQVQRFVVGNEEMLYLMSFCLPRFLNQSFDEKFVTIFHELFHIGPQFDGDLRRHRGRYCLHTHSKAGYDVRMAEYARAYLAAGANPRLHGFLRLDFSQLRRRHGHVVGTILPRAKILLLPLEQTQQLERSASRRD